MTAEGGLEDHEGQGVSRIRLGTRSELLGLLWTLALALPAAGLVIWAGAPAWLIGAACGVSYASEGLLHYWRKDYKKAQGAGVMVGFWAIVTLASVATGL